MLRTIKKSLLVLVAISSAMQLNAQPFPCNLTPCTGSLVNETYSSTVGWTNASLGTMSISGGTMNYAPCGEVNGAPRMYKSFPAITPYSNSFVAEFTTTITSLAPNSIFSPKHYLLGISNSTVDPTTTGNNTDAIFVAINSVYNTNVWNFHIAYKDDTSPVVFSTAFIPFNAIGNYSFRLIKYDVNAQLDIYLNGTLLNTIHMYICAALTNLRIVHHGRFNTDPKRKLTARVDNLRICPYTTGCNFPPSPCRIAAKDNLFQPDSDDEIFFYPNPTGLNLFVSNPANHFISLIRIRDVSGKTVKEVSASGNETLISIPTDNLKRGIYLLEIITPDKILKSKISIQH